MPTQRYVLAIDQGTTSSRAILFDAGGGIAAQSQRELVQHYPADGWVEHDPEAIWADTLAVCRDALARAGCGAEALAAIGITNQRETVVVWERATGKPIHNAIVWQDRRTADACRRLVMDGAEDLVRDRTGLVVDAYFSGTKIAWLLDNVPGARGRADRGELAAGTIDSFLLFRLTSGAVHATDAANASRTMLCDIHKGAWDAELLRLLNVPEGILPRIVDNAGELGIADAAHLGAPVPVTGMAGDQQAATFGQACFAQGSLKSTYGTGCFALLNTGSQAVPSKNRLLTTVLWSLKGQRTYAIEGSIFVAGAAIQWVRDGLGAIDTAAASEDLAKSVPDSHGVYMVPAFTGLGAPWWDPDARGAILGLTRDSNRAHIVRAALESVAYQTSDLMGAMADDVRAAGTGSLPEALRVDGGMVANDWVCQCLADTLARPVERPAVIETTALGAAYLAGLAVGFYPSLDAIASQWRLDRRFEPAQDEATRGRRLAGWADAVARVRGRG